VNESRRARRWSRRAVCGAVEVAAVALLLAGCSAHGSVAGSGTVLYEGGIQQLVPLHAGDWFLYNVVTGTRGPHFERSDLSATARKDELLLTVHEGDAEVADIQLRIDGDAVRVVSERDLSQNIGAIYATPLPLFSVPVREHAQAESTVQIVRLSDGVEIDHGHVELTITNMRDPASGIIVSQVDRRLVVTGGDLPASHRMWIRPGVGQIGTESASERRELVCAMIGGTAMGTCPTQETNTTTDEHR
jgi:hypothetical protein